MVTILAEVGGAVHGRTLVQEQPSIDEWVLGALQQHGSQTLDQMGMLLVETN
jgi:hypothetical protein